MKKLILILGLIVVGSGVFFWQQDKVDQSFSNDWQTYQNTNYGYEFKHPADVGYLSPAGGAWLGLLSAIEGEKPNTLVLAQESKGNMLLAVINSGFENADRQREEFLGSGSESRYDMSSVQINGKKFRKYSVKSGLYNGYDTAYLYEDDTHFFAITFVETPLTNQILSTFTLTSINK
jgi:hypothetical protein